MELWILNLVNNFNVPSGNQTWRAGEYTIYN